MNKICLLVLMFLTSSYAYCQVFYKKDYEKKEIEKLPVYFVLPESKDKNDKEVKEVFTKLVESYWLNKNYKIISSEEVKETIKKNEKIVVARFQGAQYSSLGRGSYGASVNEFAMSINGGVAFLTILVENQISKTDIVYALNQSQFLINNRSKFNKIYIWNEAPKLFGSQLKEKTLLIPKQYLKDMTSEEIKNAYPYKFEIVDESVITEKVLANSADYLTVNFSNYLWSDGKTSSLKILYAIKDGAIVSYSMAKLSFGSSSSGHTLKKKDFENFVKECSNE